MSLEKTEKEVRSRDKIVATAINTLFIVSIIICVTVVGQVLFQGYVSFFGYSNFRVVTGSMEPTIPVGSLAIVKKVDITTIEEGDIIEFTSIESGMEGAFITHRVVDIVTKEGQIYLETKGDANPVSDSYYVTEDNFFGKVIYYTGTQNIFVIILNIATDPIGFFGLIALPCLLIGSYTLSDCIKNLKKEMKQLSEIEAQDLESVFSEEEYQELKNSILQELLEEMKQSVEEGKTDSTTTEVE